MNLRERLMLIGAVILLGLIIFKFLIYDPYETQHASLVAARDAARAELRRNEEIIARGDQVRQEYQRLLTAIVALERKLPTTKEIPPLLSAMEQYTRRLGLDLNSFHPGALVAVVAEVPAKQGSPPAAPAGSQAGAKAIPYSKMELDLSITGTFAQTLGYLRGLHAFPRLVIVSSIALNPQQFPKLGVTLNAEIYVLGAREQ